MAKKWRLILDDNHDGFYNMALDEALLLNYPRYKIPTLRIYGWSAPFITLGYNQNAGKVLNFGENVLFTRRITAGAAILHNKELTYSIVCALKDLNLPRGIKDSYRVLCSFLIEFYSRLCLEAKFAGDIPFLSFGRYGNFCFSSWEKFDLVINGKKIGGNAQRRKQNLIFQQGSIPQKIDFELIQKTIKNAGNLESKTTFLDRILSKNTDFRYLSGILAGSFKAIFDIDFIKRGIFKEEAENLSYLAEYKYKKREWNNEKTLMA